MHPQVSRTRYRLVIFDFDGTLADSFAWFLGVFNGVAERYGFRGIHEAELDELRSLGGRELVKRLGVPSWKLPLIARHMRRLKSRDIDRIALFPGVDTLLQRLSAAGTTLAIVSSNSRRNVRRVLGPATAARIDYFECGASLFGKQVSFRRVLRRSRVAPGEALAVGDEIRDLEAARAVGIPFGAVTWGYTTAEALTSHAPDEVFTHVEQLRARIVRDRSAAQGSGAHGRLRSCGSAYESGLAPSSGRCQGTSTPSGVRRC